MTELFGIPVGTLLVVLLVAIGVTAGAIAALAGRNRVLLRLGVRNVGRRPGRTALIVLGLMLGTTIVAAAFTTGDTMSHTIRSTAVKALGETDVVVAARGAADDIPGELGAASGTGYFDAAIAGRVANALDDAALADGVAPVIVERVALQAPEQRQNEPGVSLWATDPDEMGGFGEIARVAGGTVSLADLGRGEVLLNRAGAEELRVAPGDPVLIYLGEAPAPFRVRDVVEYDGTGTADAAALLTLSEAQRLLGREGTIKQVIVSNRGTGASAAALSDEVLAALAPLERSLGLEATPVKQDAIEAADEAGNAFMALFTTFGSFSIAAGILLIFLIFVMLAAERRAELGIARAIGTRRGHLVQMFVFEGLAYDLVAALVGALLGAAVAYGMVLMMAAALGQVEAGLEVEFAVAPRSLVIAFALGVLLTLLVVAVSAWRVSVMTISSAIRNLPEPALVRRRARWLGGSAAVALGALLAANGAASGTATPLMTGVAIALIGLVPILRALGMPERVAYSAMGLTVVVILMVPWSLWEGVFGELAFDFSTWIAVGLVIVVGAVWTIVYNADLLLGAAMRSLGRIRALAPLLRMAIAYPLASRFRTGATLAVFTLVVFTLVTGTAATSSFNRAFDDVEKFGGGYDVRAGTGAAAPIDDMRAAIDAAPGLRERDFVAVGSQSVVAVDARQLGTDRPPETYLARGLDRPFLEHNTFELGAIARGYGSSRDVWNALAERPGLAVVDSFVVPHRDQFGFAIAETDFRVTGFYFDDATFEPIPLLLDDPQTGRQSRVTIIGVLSDTAPFEMIGVSTSQDTLAAAFPGRARPTIHYFDLAAGLDPAAAATRLEATFVGAGMEAESIEEVTRDAAAANRLFNNLIQGFMGLGLVVGVAALGVISARAVVERRQQIGVLRAIGFRRTTVQAALLVESSFVALTAIAVGTGLGLLLAYEIVLDQRRQRGWEDFQLVVPWVSLGVIFLAVLTVALLATLGPAVRAARVRPAEALRYQ